jgi:hypothetical protein
MIQIWSETFGHWPDGFQGAEPQAGRQEEVLATRVLRFEAGFKHAQLCHSKKPLLAPGLGHMERTQSW